jgi:hypothetical protein
MLKKPRWPWFDRLTMRIKPLKTPGFILSLSKDGDRNLRFSNIPLDRAMIDRVPAAAATS